ncbi:MAG: ADP-forming succinate--CoA ligase subunit beta [Dehalococcoidia bacterium]|nr:ADP-forming succinate--CoA ligase subunit beta [Dehalococcoidia bacterium]|tara:strand:+ start:12783 stop:14042 length:1260 start_codon:yes stop_codon:yes gene_type:complete
MKVHEYQAKALFAQFGVEVPGGSVAATPGEARAIAEELGGKVVVKAQIHAGGRGKGRLVSEGETVAMFERLINDPESNEGQVRGERVGGVRLASTAEEAEQEAANILGKHLVSIQTGPEGKFVKHVLVEEQSAVDREFYLAIIVDGAQAAPLIMASTEGGQEIEVVAAHDPEAIVRLPVNPASGYEPYIGRTLAARLGLVGEQASALNKLVGGLYRAAVESDASLAEINPLVVTEEGRVLALDAKFTVDDNALFRHQDLADLRDKDEEDRLEVLADDLGVANFIKLDGNIGCIVNGAGLAMATMDSIKFAGGEPANFLDIGTVNDPARVVNAIRVISEDPSVKAILVNIFGGMARVDIIAQGVINAEKELGLDVPVVMRLVGTNLAEGEQLLSEAGLDVIRAESLGEAAEKAVAAAGAA